MNTNPNKPAPQKFNILDSFEELKNLPTVAQLRGRGFKVAVRHERPYVLNGNVLLASKNEKAALEGIFKAPLGDPLSTGGVTFVHIYKDGKAWHGASFCSGEDNFCHRLGVAYALKRIITQTFGEGGNPLSF